MNIPLEEIKTPTLIVHGDKDAMVEHSVAIRTADLIPGSELYTVEGGWHVLGFHAKH